MSGGGGSEGGAPSSQSLEYLRAAGLPVGSGSTTYDNGMGDAQNLDAVRAAGLPIPNAGASTDFASMLRSLQASQPNQTNPALATVQGAGLPTGGGAPDGGASATGYAEGGAIGLGQGNSNSAPLQFGNQTNPTPQFNTQSSYNNFASPNQNLMDYPQQGQSNQWSQPPQGGQPQSGASSVMSSTLPNVPLDSSPDMGGMSSVNNTGYDNSGSDAGVGGQPVNQMQSPLQGQPPSLSQYRPQQGLQIQGNPTTMPVQYTQQR